MNRGAINTVVFMLIGLAGLGGMAAIFTSSGQKVDNQRTSDKLAKALNDMHLRQGAAHASLKARADRLGLGACLTASRLASTEQVHACLAAVDSLHALLDERDRLAATQYADDRSVVASLPAGPVRDEAMRGMAASTERMRQAREEMSRAELANADAVRVALQWADKNHAALHVRGESLLVSSQRQLDELQRLSAAVNATAQAARVAEQRESTVVDEADRTQLALVRQFNAMY